MNFQKLIKYLWLDIIISHNQVSSSFTQHPQRCCPWWVSMMVAEPSHCTSTTSNAWYLWCALSLYPVSPQSMNKAVNATSPQKRVKRSILKTSRPCSKRKVVSYAWQVHISAYRPRILHSVHHKQLTLCLSHRSKLLYRCWCLLVLSYITKWDNPLIL
jgi:hypothetical protein